MTNMSHILAQAPAPEPNFTPFTLTHLVVDIVCCSIMLAVVLLGRHLGKHAPAQEQTLRHTFASGCIVFWVVSNVIWNWPVAWGGGFDLSRSLPLHVCDLAGLIAPIALLTRRRIWRTLLYFWGLGLSTQAFVTPTLPEGPGEWEFWFFWFNHTIIVGLALYDTFVARQGTATVKQISPYRPHFNDVLVAMGLSLAYAAIVLPINLLIADGDLNYGYIGNAQTEHPTVLDTLGPWPARLLPLTLMVFSVFILAWMPWSILRRLGKDIDTPTPPPTPSNQTPPSKATTGVPTRP